MSSARRAVNNSTPGWKNESIPGQRSVTTQAPAPAASKMRVGGEKPKPKRVIVGRLVLTSPAAGQLMKHLQRLAVQAEAASAPPPDATRN